MPVWFRLFYCVLWLAVGPVALLRLWWKGRLNPGYREHWRERLALDLPTSPALPQGRFDLWIHAVSVGEARAMLPLLDAVRASYPNILVTCTTPTGRAAATELLKGSATVAYLPFDAPWLVSRFLRAVQPRLGLLIETELWPGICDAAKRAGVPLWLVNARLSQRSADGYAKGGALTRAMLACLSGIAAQTEDHASRFRSLGANHVHVTGNLKFDIALPNDVVERAVALAKHVAVGRKLWVAGSTRAGEEVLLLDALRDHALRHKAIAVIVPRHPERWQSAVLAARERGFRIARRTDVNISADTEVIIGDSMGEMLSYYGGARAVVMGGTLGGTGGQNLIEPCALAVPVVLGPSVFNFQQAADEAVAAGAAVSVPHAEAALGAVLAWFADDASREDASTRARTFVMAHQGATARTVALINADP